MELRFDAQKPIYIQLADWLSDLIISGSIPEGGQVPSTTEISVQYKVNPATALKGINMLVEKGIIFKKRGLGMFVSDGAVEKLRAERRELFQKTYVDKLCEEAKKLGISKNEIVQMIENRKGF